MVLLVHQVCAFDLELRLRHWKVWADGHSCAPLVEGSKSNQLCGSLYPIHQIILLTQIRLGKSHPSRVTSTKSFTHKGESLGERASGNANGTPKQDLLVFSKLPATVSISQSPGPEGKWLEEVQSHPGSCREVRGWDSKPRWGSTSPTRMELQQLQLTLTKLPKSRGNTWNWGYQDTVHQMMGSATEPGNKRSWFCSGERETQLICPASYWACSSLHSVCPSNCCSLSAQESNTHKPLSLEVAHSPNR